MEAMNDIERESYDAWLKHGSNMSERVALIVQDGEGAMWYRMHNSAQPVENGRGEFFVEGDELMRACRVAAEELGYVRLGTDVRAGIDAMLRERVVVIWHTHTATTDPSREDIAEFPTWLADYGMVYHVPTGATTVYNQSGVISSPRAEVEPSIATSKE